MSKNESKPFMVIPSPPEAGKALVVEQGTCRVVKTFESDRSAKISAGVRNAKENQSRKG